VEDEGEENEKRTRGEEEMREKTTGNETQWWDRMKI
jgi:hypothetical protein